MAWLPSTRCLPSLASGPHATREALVSSTPSCCDPERRLTPVCLRPQVPGFGWVQIVLLAGILEAGPFKQDPDALPGDFGLKYFGKKLPDGDEKADKLNKELSNGRLAMMGILGALVEDKITGSFLPVGIPGVDFTPGA